MFAESLLDSSPVAHTRRGWSTLVSFGAQLLAVAALFIAPLIYTQRISSWHASMPIFVPAAPRRVTEPGPRRAERTAAVQVAATPFTAPRVIPNHIADVRDEAVVATPDLELFHGTRGASGSGGDVPGGLGDAPVVIPPPPPRPAAKPLRVSHMMEGNLIEKIAPQYPRLAMLAHVQGAVLLRAIISREGTIENLQVVNGSPMLTQAALEAVRRWRYRPYILNEEPVEVETQITVNFVLGR